MKTRTSASPARAMLIAVLAVGAGLLAASSTGSAQVPQPRDAPPPGTGEVPQAASPRGAVYIPGVGFRFVPPAGPRVYGYYYGPRVYGHYDDRESRRYHHGYRAHRVSCGWHGERCGRRWR